MKKIVSIILVSAFFTGVFLSPVFSEDKTGDTKGLIKEYLQEEEKNKQEQALSAKQRKIILVKNLFRAIRTTLLRRSTNLDYTESVYKLVPDDLKFERQEGTFNYYARITLNLKEADESGKKAKVYFARFEYLVNPERYLQDPKRINIVEKDANVEHP